MMNSNKTDIHALHGFLGLHTDWNIFEFIDHSIKIENHELDFWAWANSFNSTVKKQNKMNILLGYSLGARLAMHAFIANPSLWDGAIFVSAHLGLSSDSERAARLQADRQWAERFLVDSWEKLMHDWNLNPVFGHQSFPFPRDEKHFDRKKLAQQLVNWSLGKQEPLLDRLRSLSTPILMIAGELDTKFSHQANQCRNFCKVSIIPQAAHRVPWDQPEKFNEQITKFIEELHDKK